MICPFAQSLFITGTRSYGHKICSEVPVLKGTNYFDICTQFGRNCFVYCSNISFQPLSLLRELSVVSQYPPCPDHSSIGNNARMV
jgi:hypothetical protein